MPTRSSLANPIKSFERELLVVLVDFKNSFVEFIREVPNLKDRENQQRGQTKELHEMERSTKFSHSHVGVNIHQRHMLKHC